MPEKNKISTGFTLIELLIAIAVIGLLVTFSIVALNNARMKSRDAARVAAIKQIQSALELYYNDASVYPSVASTTMGIPGGTAGGMIKNGNATYLNIIPTNPAPTNDGVCDSSAPFTYSVNGTASSYTLQYCLGGGAAGGITPGPHTATAIGLMNP